jgi:TolB-like protein/DNA-binding winged helix-turn-helix (wHTH) protein/Tfp pilus assembly protein PilF
MSFPPPKKYRLGEFELDTSQHRLSHRQEQVSLPALPFQVLLFLVENRDRYLTRQELLDRFWEGADSYEETLTRCISTIRTELRDPPTNPTYIETRKKVGYRYIGPCEVVAGETAAKHAPESVAEFAKGFEGNPSAQDVSLPPISESLRAPSSERRGGSLKKVLAVVAVVLALLLALAVYLGWPVPQAANEPVPIHSIAVLPLKNLTGDPANDYFSDGLTESLINSLAKVESLEVQSRSSVFRFKNKDLDPREVGRQLGVAAVLEGSVRNLTNSVRVAVRLVSVADGRVLWVSDANDQSIGNLFAIQDEIARNVAAGLRLRLSGETEQRLARRYTEDIEAYQLYLQGRFALANYVTNDDLQKAVKYFEAAVAKDSNYALAYTGLADAYMTMALDWRDPKEVYPKASQYADRALALDDNLGEAHYSRGAVAYFYEWNWPEAQRELQRSLDLNARSLEGNVCYLHSLETLGQPDAATAQVRRALSQNPLSTSISAELGCTSYYAHRFEQTIEFSRQTLASDPSYPLAHYNLARALGQEHLYDQAIGELSEPIRVGGRTAMLLSELAYDQAASGHQPEARQLLSELQKRAATEYIDQYPLAWIYVALGENDHALASLEKAYEARSAWMPWIKVEPKFEPLHNTPRFAALLKRLQLDG